MQQEMQRRRGRTPPPAAAATARGALTNTNNDTITYKMSSSSLSSSSSTAVLIRRRSRNSRLMSTASSSYSSALLLVTMMMFIGLINLISNDGGNVMVSAQSIVIVNDDTTQEGQDQALDNLDSSVIGSSSSSNNTASATTDTTAATTTGGNNNSSSSSSITLIDEDDLAMLFPPTSSPLSTTTGVDVGTTSSSSCYMKHDADALQSTKKTTYTIGVLAIRGDEAAYNEFNVTFNKYLTEAVGKQRFTTPIEFVMKPLNFLTLFTDTEASNVDFIYVNPSAFSCIESEYGASSLVSQVSHRKVYGVNYYLKQFGGVIMTLANRTDIVDITDLRGKIIAAASISGLGSGQMQFRQMLLAGLDYLNDPKQLVFTSNQGSVVDGVLRGDFDVGFVRTDQLERSTDADGNPIDISQFKIINIKQNLTLLDGITHFPFNSSTLLYPEWNLAALNHVPDIIQTEVQNAMLAIKQHAAVSEFNTNANTDTLFRRCDTTDEIANIAYNATVNGKYSEWVPSLSYMELRNMQESTGFIQLDTTTNQWRCLRSSEIYDSISCPVGQIKKTIEQVHTGCEDVGLQCQEDYQCICSPCYVPLNCIDSVEIGGKCVQYNVFLPALLVPIACIFLCACFGALGCKSKQMVKQAELAAKNERDLNEFIAHEVRNPLSAALSASVFVTSAVQCHMTDDTLDSLREDANIISSSLRFINDLLRSMLDVHRATRDQMVLETDTIDILHDIFEPTASMIYARDTNFEVLIDCPEGMVIEADKLRLQQVVLNLARNSAKFVDVGFVRLRAATDDNGHVNLYIEDSGPGIPEEKRKDLFNKYQKSLDSLAQGTGVGLSLVEKLVNLMDGEIYLDESYDSGHEGNPGACMVINLKQKPQEVDDDDIETGVVDLAALKNGQDLAKYTMSEDLERQLPKYLNVLFVDDDRNIRKLAIRSLRRVRPDWTIREAASGEACLQVCSDPDTTFDLIFMDQYMTSVEQCLKGTETVRALRSRGVSSIVCGLSANNLEFVFLEAGADMFNVKPFPIEPQDVTSLLVKLFRKRTDLAVTDISSARLDNSSCCDLESQSGMSSTGRLTDDESPPGTPGSGVAMAPAAARKALRKKRKEQLKKRKSASKLSSSKRTEQRRVHINTLVDCGEYKRDDSSGSDSKYEIQKSLSVLFVDDDRTLRRLAMRALKNIMPDCRVREAQSGESALILCQTEVFDVIFVDQYMVSSVESLVGTDTVKALRKNGVSSIICGLSANQQEVEFKQAGADHFLQKPFPCKEDELGPVLVELLMKRSEMKRPAC